MIAFQGVEYSEIFSFQLCYVCYSLGRCSGWVTLSANKSVEFRQIDAQTDAIGIFLWRHHYWGTPFSGHRNWGDDTLADEEINLVLKLVPVGERDCSRSSDAEWSGVGR